MKETAERVDATVPPGPTLAPLTEEPWLTSHQVAEMLPPLANGQARGEAWVRLRMPVPPHARIGQTPYWLGSSIRAWLASLAAPPAE